MTRSKRISKLGRAIWEYRGRYNVHSGKWTQQPNPAAVQRVRHWLEALGVVDIEVTIKRIDGLKSHEEYRAFLKELE